MDSSFFWVEIYVKEIHQKEGEKKHLFNHCSLKSSIF